VSRPSSGPASAEAPQSALAHATAIELYELSAGLAPEAAAAHLASCAACREKVQTLKAHRAQTQADPRFAQGLSKLPTPAQARRPRLLWIIPAGALAAAALLVVVRPAPGLRAKATASVELRGVPGRDPSAPRVGDLLELHLSAGAHRHALSIAVDDKGVPSLLWPEGAGPPVQSAPLPPGARATVRLRVTPGPVRILSALSDEPLTLADLLAKRPRADVEYAEQSLRPVPAP
jgi:hypothetical protein